jgi:type IV pilus assembly protein PilE
MSGFSLMELIIVIVIISLLASLSMGEYQSFIRKSRRSDAQTSLLDYHARLQRCYLGTYNYTLCIEEFGLDKPLLSFSHFYLVQAIENTDNKYRLQATAIGEQEKDTTCYRFTINSLQQTQAYSKDNHETLNCWGK